MIKFSAKELPRVCEEFLHWEFDYVVGFYPLSANSTGIGSCSWGNGTKYTVYIFMLKTVFILRL